MGSLFLACRKGDFGLALLSALLCLPLPGRAQESWDAVYIAGKRVGYVHVMVNPLDEGGKKLLNVRYDMLLNLKRGRDELPIEQMYGTIETPDGEVLRFEVRSRVSQQETLRTRGELKGGKMEMTLNAGGTSKQDSLDWGPDVRGPYAAELSLSRRLMKAGETRDVKTFIPDLNKICMTHMQARGTEEVELGGGAKRPLMRIDFNLTDLEGKAMPGLDGSYWVDDGGQILKSFTDALGGLATYRTTREAALASAVGGKVDILTSSILKVAHKISTPYSKRAAVYRLSLRPETKDILAEVFPNDRRQTLKPNAGGRTASLSVRTAGPNEGTAQSEPIGEEFSRPNPMINSADAKVVALTQKAVGNATDPWAKAVAIEHWVFQNISKKNFSTAFATASEVAVTLAGDCTEHSVLSAAMCRAAGIPSRCAIGLIYAEDMGGFGFHMWTEVFVNNRWVALDAAWDQSQVDAVHIKLSDTSLDGVSPFEQYLAVVRVYDKITIDPVEVR